MAARRANQSSDLAARVIAAIPAIGFAVAIVVLGEWYFVAGLILLGWVCLHEAFAMLDGAHPVRLAGFIGFAGLLVATFSCDTGAYFAGRAFGRRPLAPAISPNKTVEGFAGGFVAAIIGAEVAALYQVWFSGWDALWLGLAIAVAAPLGDLFESYLKRDRGVKDAGSLFGAHGGALDRLDAVLFTAVAGYYVWLALM